MLKYWWKCKTYGWLLQEVDYKSYTILFQIANLGTAGLMGIFRKRTLTHFGSERMLRPVVRAATGNTNVKVKKYFSNKTIFLNSKLDNFVF